MPVPQADPVRSRQAALAIVRALRQAGHLAYFAGGCVRDELLGLAPSDYDVATDATPQRIRGLFPSSNEVGAAFGVMLVKQGDVVNEVATFRADGVYTDKRRPDQVRFSSPEDDAARRDFTVNALFLDPLNAGDPHDAGNANRTTSPRGGVVIDLVGGLADLRARVLRAVGDPEKRLAEDHLRALRAARLAAKLGFEVEPATADAIRRHAAQLVGVSRERIGDEIRRLLAHASRRRGVELLRDLHLDAPCLDEPAQPKLEPRSIAQLPERASVPLALAAWATDRGSTAHADTLRWRRALCLSNDEHSWFSDVLRQQPVLLQDWNQARVSRQKRLSVLDCFSDALTLLATRHPAQAKAIADRVEALRRTPSGLAPPPLITGDDLVALGLRPGPRFKAWLDAAYDAQLEDRATTQAEALELIRGMGV